MVRRTGRTDPERYLGLRTRVGQALREVSKVKRKGMTGPVRGLG